MNRTHPRLRAAVCVGALVIGIGLLSACSSRAITTVADVGAAPSTPTAQTYGYTGDTQSVTVPAGVTTASVVVIGAAGGAASAFGSTYGTPGGRGAKISGTLAVTPGDVLTLCVGGVGGVNDSNKAFGRGGWSCGTAASAGTVCNGTFAGGDGGSSKGATGTHWDGAGGGGASAILQQSSGAPLVVAGAGGGAARAGGGGDGGKDTGGNGVMDEMQQTPAHGGASGTAWSAKGQSPHKTTWNAAGLGGGGGGGGGGCHNGQGGLVDSNDALINGGSAGGGNSLVTALSAVTAAVGATGAAGSITITFTTSSAG